MTAVVLVPSVLFLVLLAVVHLSDPDMVEKPLSMFRDGRWAAAGYALFGLLFLMGLGQVRAYRVLGRRDALWVPVFALVLLAVVGLTPSWDADHGAASFLLLAVIFGYYFTRLYLAESPWVFAHVAVPVVLFMVTAVTFSYGIWQKGLIVYFVVAVNLDCLAAIPKPEGRRRRTTASYRPRVIWRRTDDRGG